MSYRSPPHVAKNKSKGTTGVVTQIDHARSNLHSGLR